MNGKLLEHQRHRQHWNESYWEGADQKINTIDLDWSLRLPMGTSQMPPVEKFDSQTSQKIELVVTMTWGMFEGIKVRFSNLLQQLSSMMVVARCFGAVLLPVVLVHCTKWMEQLKKRTTSRFFNYTSHQQLEDWSTYKPLGVPTGQWCQTHNKIGLERLKKDNIKLLEWCFQSAEFTPVKNLWKTLKSWIHLDPSKQFKSTIPILPSRVN